MNILHRIWGVFCAHCSNITSGRCSCTFDMLCIYYYLFCFSSNCMCNIKKVLSLFLYVNTQKSQFNLQVIFYLWIISTTFVVFLFSLIKISLCSIVCMVVWNFIYLFPHRLDVFIDVREWQVALDWIQNLDWCLLYCFHVHICHKLWLYLFMCVIHNIALRSLKYCWVSMYVVSRVHAISMPFACCGIMV